MTALTEINVATAIRNKFEILFSSRDSTQRRMSCIGLIVKDDQPGIPLRSECIMTLFMALSTPQCYVL
jgi:hypothetical protein